MKIKPYIIGISGASCSGKTWLATKIRNKRPDVISIIALDNYYKDISFVNSLEYRHDNPNAIDYTNVISDIEKLIGGNSINVPKYDYDLHSTIGTSLIEPTPIIIIEGLFTYFNPRLRELIDFKIWIDVEEKIILERRLKRDIEERGDNYDSAMIRYEQDTKPAYYKYIEPLKILADIKFKIDSYDK